MNPVEPNLNVSIAISALKVWMDFWEITGRLRVEIIRLSKTGGDAPNMIAPDISEVVIPAVPAVLIHNNQDETISRPGQIPCHSVSLELIDTVRNTDRIRMRNFIYEIDSVLKKNMGDFSIWIVDMHRID